MSEATSSNPQEDRRQRYEQLGAPVLLYRHLPSYAPVTSDEYNINPGPWDANTASKTRPAHRRARVETTKEKIAARAREVCTDDLQRVSRAKMRQHGGLHVQLAERYEHDYHHRSMAGGGGDARTERSSTSKSKSTSRSSAGGTDPQPPPPPVDPVTRRRRRDEAFPEYCAPFGSGVVAWGLTDELDRMNVLGYNATAASSSAADNDRTGGRKRRYKYYGLAKDEADEELTVPSVCRGAPPSPADYGNCLVVLPCRCRSSRFGRSQCCWFVVHPTGERLDAVSVSRIVLPRQSAANNLGRNNGGSSRTVPLGERLMQISICGANKGWDPNDSGRRMLIVRTRSRCIVISSTWIDYSASSTQAEGGQAGGQNCCSGGNYTLKKVSEINFFPPSHKDSQSFVPMHVAPIPNTIGTDACAPTTFAVLSHSKPSSMSEKGLLSTSESPQQNVVHYAFVQLDNDCSMTSPVPTVKEHAIPGLRHISQIEFTHHHPMVLWASARSGILYKPAVHHKVITTAHKRPLSGRGSNLYSIDLRTNEPALVFNPSHGERMVDGLHSVTAILPDCTQMHKAYIQSVSAGSKVWEIDGRMPGRSVCSWSLPGLCDGWGFTGQHGGLHGWGSILTQPVVTNMDDKHLPLLGVSKSFGVGHIGMYQRPEVYPRFATQPLECSSLDKSSGNKGFALSSSFTLPDVSDRIYNYGLAAFRTNISPLLGTNGRGVFDVEGDDVIDALCVLSMTSRGDLYGHALACHRLAQTKARSFSGLRTGCCAVPIPNELESGDTDNFMHGDISWRLKNVFPTPSSAIISQIITSRDDVRPFYDFDRRRIPSNVDDRKPPRRRRASNKPAETAEDAMIAAENEEEVLPRTVYEVVGFKNGENPNGITCNTVGYCRDKGSNVSSSTGPFVSVNAVGADTSTNKQQVAISVDQSHSSISLDHEKTCEVVAKKGRTLKSDGENNNGDENETDLLPCTLHKLQNRWGTNTHGSGVELERMGRNCSFSSSSDDDNHASI